MVSRIITLKDVCVLIPRTCKYTTVCVSGKRDFIDVLTDLREGDHSGLSGWAQMNYKNCYKGESRGVEKEV